VIKLKKKKKKKKYIMIFIFHNKMKNKKYYTVRTLPKYYTVGTLPKSNRNFIERGKIDTPYFYTHIYDCSLSWLGTDTAIKSGRVKLE
jgi:hypothetical protein